MKKTLPFVLSILTVSALASSTAFAGPQENKKIVEAFYDMAFNQHKPKEAALKYLTKEYIQHNPYVTSGRDAFIDFFSKLPKEDPAKTLFKRTLAEGDLVVLHSHRVPKPGDRGSAGVDIFRVENGKIAEHWDVNQDIPEKAANTNTMF